MSLTIDEIKKKKITLESSILKLVQDFEKETDSFVSYLNFDRAISKDKKVSEAAHTYTPEPERKGSIENIDVSMRFDL